MKIRLSELKRIIGSEVRRTLCEGPGKRYGQLDRDLDRAAPHVLRAMGYRSVAAYKQKMPRDVYLGRLYTKIEAAGDLDGFIVTYEHPGYIKLERPGDAFDIAATPDHETEDMMPVDVSTDDGDVPFDAIVPFKLTMDIATDVRKWRTTISELLPKILMSV